MKSQEQKKCCLIGHILHQSSLDDALQIKTARGNYAIYCELF